MTCFRETWACTSGPGSTLIRFKNVAPLFQFESLLFVLILVLSMKNSACGTPVHHKGNRESASLNLGRNCLNSKNTEFPRRVKVDVRFSNPNPATEVASDVNNRSLSPWDYR